MNKQRKLNIIYFMLIPLILINGQRFHIKPKDGLVDERLSIQVTGLPPRQPVVIRAQAQDIDGRLWQSFAGFYADEKGTIDLSRQEPVNGDYVGIKEMGLILSMDLPISQRKGARFTYHYSEPILVRFSVELNGQEVASTLVTRRWGSPDLIVQKVRENGLLGTYFQPARNGPFPGLIVLGGSEGGLTTQEAAAQFASHGYAVMGLAYFGIEGLPELLEEIPIEYFKKAIDWMVSNPNVLEDKIGLVGTSKGAEAALIVGSFYSQIKFVVGYSSGSVVWSSIYGSKKSSWSYQDSPLPCIGPGGDPTYRPPREYPIRPMINYLYRLKNTNEVQKAMIPVERINGPVLLISGKDDQLFPSFTMSEMVMERLRINNHPFEFKHLAYENAGHQIRKFYLPMAGSTAVAGGRLVLGGTIEGNIKAMEDSWPKVLEFLKRAISNNK